MFKGGDKNLKLKGFPLMILGIILIAIPLYASGNKEEFDLEIEEPPSVEKDILENTIKTEEALTPEEVLALQNQIKQPEEKAEKEFLTTNITPLTTSTFVEGFSMTPVEVESFDDEIRKDLENQKIRIDEQDNGLKTQKDKLNVLSDSLETMKDQLLNIDSLKNDITALSNTTLKNEHMVILKTQIAEIEKQTAIIQTGLEKDKKIQETTNRHFEKQQDKLEKTIDDMKTETKMLQRKILHLQIAFVIFMLLTATSFIGIIFSIKKQTQKKQDKLQ